jgi:hypothetical protein
VCGRRARGGPVVQFLLDATEDKMATAEAGCPSSPAATIHPGSPPTPFAPGAVSPVPAPVGSSWALRGRTHGSSPTARDPRRGPRHQTFDAILEARVLAAEWRSEYTTTATPPSDAHPNRVPSPLVDQPTPTLATGPANNGVEPRKLRPTNEMIIDDASARCRPPAAWDHFEVSSASSMGPPFRQLWDHPGVHQLRRC